MQPGREEAQESQREEPLRKNYGRHLAQALPLEQEEQPWGQGGQEPPLGKKPEVQSEQEEALSQFWQPGMSDRQGVHCWEPSRAKELWQWVALRQRRQLGRAEAHCWQAEEARKKPLAKSQARQPEGSQTRQPCERESQVRQAAEGESRRKPCRHCEQLEEAEHSEQPGEQRSQVAPLRMKPRSQLRHEEEFLQIVQP